MVAYRLKVPTYQEQVDFIVVLRLESGDMLVNRVQLAVATSFDRNLLIVRCGNNVAYLELAFILRIAEIGVGAEGVSRSITDLDEAVYHISTFNRYRDMCMYQLRLWVIFNTE